MLSLGVKQWIRSNEFELGNWLVEICFVVHENEVTDMKMRDIYVSEKNIVMSFVYTGCRVPCS